MTSPALSRHHAWPEADRAAWEAMTTPAAHVLDDPGALAHRRAPSLTIIAISYDLWLRWLRKADPEALPLAPAERGTPERLMAWMGSLTEAGLAPMSRSMRLEGVLRLMMATAPDLHWKRQQRLRAHLRRNAFRSYSQHKKGRILPTETLLQVGLDLVGPLADAAPTLAQAMVARRGRDGLLVAFLALLPLRLTSLRTLELGHSVLRVASGWTIVIEGNRMKAGRPWEAPLPVQLVEAFARYVDEVRPWFMDRTAASHDWLWVNDHDGPYKNDALSVRVGDITTALTGKRVSPHLFRDALATTLVRASRDAARLIRAILGHADYRTADQHYVHAQGIEAGRTYAELIGRLAGKAS